MATEITQDDIREDEIEIDQYLVFEIKEQEFGIQIIRVQEIISALETSEVPDAPDYIEGIASLRGRLATVLNFRLKFSMPQKERDEDTRIIIVEQQGYPVGITVDSVIEVLKIPDEKLQELPESMHISVSADVIAGVGVMDERLVVLLDLDKLLSGDDYTQMAQTARMIKTEDEPVGVEA